MIGAAARIRVAALLVAAALLAGPSPGAAQAPKIGQLGGVAEMKSWFNANQGHPRIIFLLSPT